MLIALLGKQGHFLGDLEAIHHGWVVERMRNGFSSSGFLASAVGTTVLKQSRKGES